MGTANRGAKIARRRAQAKKSKMGIKISENLPKNQKNQKNAEKMQ